MNVGIICEFDPLHRGHAHLLAQARAMGASAVVCAMSGRGFDGLRNAGARSSPRRAGSWSTASP